MTLASITSEPITEAQKRDIRTRFSAAVDKGLEVIPIDKAGGQKIIECGDEIQTLILDFLRIKMVGQYTDEEVPSQYSYLSGYNSKPELAANLADLEREREVLRGAFPELATADYDHGLVEKIRAGEITLPTGAERWTLIPRWQMLAGSYNDAFGKVLEAVRKARRGKVVNYREGQTGPEYLRQSQRSVAKWEELEKSQPGHDLLVVPIQAGLLHRGRSVRRAREVFLINELGLGALEVGILILTHPERLRHMNDLWIDCAGDEYAPVADGKFSCAPCWRFRGDEVGFGTDGVGDASEYYGAASGFSPQ